MNHQVLLADDSLTIQKVIKITLANQPYDITDVSSEDELFQKLPQVQPKLVFLDFNLSEKYTGYELTSKIKSISPSTKVLLLLGTFDTVDDNSMEKCGASDKIVKPFDSNKFIAICKQLIDTFADEDEISYPEPIQEEEPAFTSETPEDQWEMSHSTEQSLPGPELETSSQPEVEKNALHDEVSDWGMSVPGVINQSSDADALGDIPPVIGEVKSLKEHKAREPESQGDSTKYPDNEDLDYPTIEELNEQAEAKTLPEAPQTTSKLLSIDSFNNQPEEEFELEGNYVSGDSDHRSIEDQIRDEVEDDLWKADEFEELKKEVSSKIEEVKGGFQPSREDFDDSLFQSNEESSIDWDMNQNESRPQESMASFDKDEMKKEMEEMVKKYVKEYMDQMFQKNTEKIAWEVIPDLAENLIRQELSKISHKILNDQN